MFHSLATLKWSYIYIYPATLYYICSRNIIIIYIYTVRSIDLYMFVYSICLRYMTHMHMYTSMEPLLVYVYIWRKGLWIIKLKRNSWKKEIDCKEDQLFIYDIIHEKNIYVYDFLHETPELQSSHLYIYIYIYSSKR